jgi:hypothetical protein
MFLDSRIKPTAADAIPVLNPNPANDWAADPFRWDGWGYDTAHIPDPFFGAYMLTGDLFYLEGLQFWAETISMDSNPAYRGPGAAAIGQVRAVAWRIRNFGNAQVATPDADPVKAVIGSMIEDSLAYWEGYRNITGTRREGNAEWTFARARAAANSPWENPLHWWVQEIEPDNIINPPLDRAVVGGFISTWMQDYLIGAIGRTVELGFDTQTVFAWLGQNLIGQLTDPKYNRALYTSYESPTLKKGAVLGPFLDWADTLTGFLDPEKTRRTVSRSPTSYTVIGRSAAAFTFTLPGGSDAWTSVNAVIAASGGVLNFGSDPTWAIVPRQ